MNLLQNCTSNSHWHEKRREIEFPGKDSTFWDVSGGLNGQAMPDTGQTFCENVSFFHTAFCCLKTVEGRMKLKIFFS